MLIFSEFSFSSVCKSLIDLDVLFKIYYLYLSYLKFASGFIEIEASGES